MNNQLCGSLLLALLLPLPALAEPVDLKDSSVHWQSLPASESSIPASQAIWGVLPPQETLPADPGLIWEPLLNEAGQQLSPTTPSVVWQSLKPGEPDLLPLIPIDPKIAALSVPLPPVPALQSFNRSIAFSDGVVGPDIGFLVPPGFRWSSKSFVDASVRGWNRRPPGSDFLAWNDGDAVGQLFVRLFQRQKWTFGINFGFRSLYQGDQVAGGATSIGEGFSSGFRIDYALSDTAGIAFGAEQLVHYDNNTDTGRDIYLVVSKAWWLGGRAGSYPLLTGTAGIGTGYFGTLSDVKFACSDALGGAGVSVDVFYPLCWGPIASAAIVFNPYLSIFGEYNNYSLMAGISLVPVQPLPLRVTWGITIAESFDNYEIESDEFRWFFRVSLGL